MTSEERAVHFLLAAIGLLMAISVFFLIVSVALWAKNKRDARRIGELHSRWSRKLFDCLSRASSPSEFRLLVGKSEADALLDFLLLYAARLRGDEQRILIEIAAPYLERVAETCQRGNQYRRAWATRVLGTFGWPACRPHLIKAVQDRSPHVAMTAFRCLIANGDEKSFEVLVWSLKRFGKWNRNLMALLIASVGRHSLGPIRRGFEDESQPEFVRVILCTALREINDAVSADIAARILERQPPLDLAIACVRLIRSLGTSAHAPLMRKFARSPNGALRAQAIRALGRLGDASDLAVLRAGIDDPSPWAALHSARALRDLRMDAMLEQLVRDGHPRAVLARQVLEG